MISTRRQIIKLLVLLRWAKDNNQDTEKAINLIAFLQRQNYQLERAVDALKGVETLLAGARCLSLLSGMMEPAVYTKLLSLRIEFGTMTCRQLPTSSRLEHIRLSLRSSMYAVRLCCVLSMEADLPVLAIC